jgi:hypothetical protein
LPLTIRSLHGFGKALARSTGHWNERGHQVAGDLISNTIRDPAGRQELLAHPD